MNLREQLHRVAVVLLLTVPVVAYGSATDADLQKEYGNKILTLRQFYPGAQLRFDATGRAASTVAPSAWTLDGQLRVQDIFLKDGVVHVRGQRLFLFYDSESKRLRDAGTVTKDESASKYFRKKIGAWAAEMGKIEIEVECGEPRPEMADVIKAMNAVFLSSDEQLTDVVPDFWKTWLDAKDKSEKQIVNPTGLGYGDVPKVGAGISAPHAMYAPDPEYSEPARQAGYQGTTVLWLVVDPDGLPEDIRIGKPAGLGLDEQAVNAVRKWKFYPAKKDGDPVAVQINVEVNFRLD